MQALCDGQLGSFRESLTEFSDKLDKLSYCIISIVNEEEAAQLRVHKDVSPRGSQDPNATTMTSGMKVHIAGSGTEMAAALEHELNQGGVPRRNNETGRFKNISDLAQEIKYQSEKHQSSVSMFKDKAKEIM
jgi:hypothetical protein